MQTGQPMFQGQPISEEEIQKLPLKSQIEFRDRVVVFIPHFNNESFVERFNGEYKAQSDIVNLRAAVSNSEFYIPGVRESIDWQANYRGRKVKGTHLISNLFEEQKDETSQVSILKGSFKAIALLYAAAHIFASNSSGPFVHIVFYIDDKNVLEYVTTKVERYYHLFPLNVEIIVKYYDGAEIGNKKSHYIRKGTKDLFSTNLHWMAYISEFCKALENDSDLDILEYFNFLTHLDKLSNLKESKETKSELVDVTAELKQLAKQFADEINKIKSNVSRKEVQYYSHVLECMHNVITNPNGSWNGRVTHYENALEVLEVFSTDDQIERCKYIAKLFLSLLILAGVTVGFGYLIHFILPDPTANLTLASIMEPAAVITAFIFLYSMTALSAIYYFLELKDFVVPPKNITQAGLTFFEKLRTCEVTRERLSLKPHFA